MPAGKKYGGRQVFGGCVRFADNIAMSWSHSHPQAALRAERDEQARVSPLKRENAALRRRLESAAGVGAAVDTHLGPG